MFRRHVPILFVILTLMPAAVAGAQTKLQLTVHTRHGANGYDVNSTMISGDKDMLLIDPQFSLSEAHRLAAEILESRKNLAVIVRCEWTTPKRTLASSESRLFF